MAGKIFISYRRGDDAGNTGRLFDRLQEAFQPDQLFIDVDSIAPGLDFVRVLGEQVAQCDVLLAVIGKRWLDERDASGARRLDNPEDFVRIEIESALNQGKRVIPVLVGEAPMPSSDELPQAIRLLARRNAVRLTHERFRADANGLIKALQGALQETAMTRLAEAEAFRNEQEAGLPARDNAANNAAALSDETPSGKPKAGGRLPLLLIAGLAVTTGAVAALIWTREAGLTPIGATPPQSVEHQSLPQSQTGHAAKVGSSESEPTSKLKDVSSLTALDSMPLQPEAKVLSDDVISVAANRASGTSMFTPRSGIFTLDYEVENGKEMMITLVNGDQYQQMLSGRMPSGDPVLKVIVKGTGSELVILDRGNYFLAFNNRQETDSRMRYRGSFVEPLDSIKLGPATKILKQGTFTVPPLTADARLDSAGSDISVPDRGWLGIDFSIADKRELTLLMVDGRQKDLVVAGRDPVGDPLMRILIKGPETASQDAVVSHGTYFFAFLNRSSIPTKIIYRATFRPF